MATFSQLLRRPTFMQTSPMQVTLHVEKLRTRVRTGSMDLEKIVEKWQQQLKAFQ